MPWAPRSLTSARVYNLSFSVLSENTLLSDSLANVLDVHTALRRIMFRGQERVTRDGRDAGFEAERVFIKEDPVTGAGPCTRDKAGLGNGLRYAF